MKLKNIFFIFGIMEFVVYILYSKKHDIHYTGYTSDLVNRFRFRNELSNKGFTVKHRPWKVIYIENKNRVF